MFLELYTLTNSTGADEILKDTIAQVPVFTPALLFFVFGLVLLGGITRQKARTGTTDLPMWMTIASLSTFLVALMLSLSQGFISLEWLVIVTVITIFSGIWLFLDRRITEV